MARFLATIVLLLLSFAATAADAKLGMGIQIDAEAFAIDPVVTRVLVTNVEPRSLAAGAGIVEGDELVSVQGQAVKGRHASVLKPYISFGAGETRTFGLKHANGENFEATITKPK